ncbi:hypothetical protein ABDF71_21585 [Ochrobactrum sp. WV_118_8]
MSIPAHRLALAVETKAERSARRAWAGPAVVRRPAMVQPVESYSLFDDAYLTLSNIGLALAFGFVGGCVLALFGMPF